jgi:hypothetical protein
LTIHCIKWAYARQFQLAIKKLPKQWCGWNLTSRGTKAAVDLALAALKLPCTNMVIITKTIPKGWKNAACYLDCQLADLG